jgi:2-polyprenyl-6-methoxyphenol hydroxylase-like FAD-dependent oxidoreductase
MHSTGGQRNRAVVIGGSIGGLFAGLFLRKVGWEISIHERAGEELGSRGAGIATHDDLHEALALATEQGGEVGVAVEGRIVLARSGDVVCEVARPQVLASWDRIWQRLRLRASDVYRHRSGLVSVEQDEQCVVARFDDGSEVVADLLVAADGIQSTVRRQLLPAVEPRYAGYVAWRGLADMAELSEKARDRLRNKFAFCLPDRAQALGYPVDGGPGSGAATIVSGTAPPIRCRICRACLLAPMAVNIPARFRRTGCIPTCSCGCRPTRPVCWRRLSPR